jgi:hypothetical protein
VASAVEIGVRGRRFEEEELLRDTLEQMFECVGTIP